MKHVLIVLTLLLITGFSNETFSQFTITQSFQFGGETRGYIVYIPANYTGNKPVPLLFNFHGRYMSAAQQMSMCDFRPVADTAGFILVHPQGTMFGGALSWNVGGEGFTQGMTMDDIGFTEKMLDTLDKQLNLDLSRIYSVGFSNGGFFSFELVCQLSDKIAAVGSVGGSMTPQTMNNCDPNHPTPIIQIHGTTDALVSYDGAVWSVPVSNAISYWTNYNHTAISPVITNLPDLNTADGSTVKHEVYSGGDSCAVVEHYRVIGGPHHWPLVGGDPTKQNVDFSASSAMWKFVSQFDINGKITCKPAGLTENTEGVEVLSVYPNPSSNQFTVVLPINSTELVVFDMLGKQILAIQTKEKQMSFQLENSGFYMLHVKGKFGTQVRKLVVNN